MEKALYPGFRQAQLTGLYELLLGGLGGLTVGLSWRNGYTLHALTAEQPSRPVSPLAGIGTWLAVVAVLLVSWMVNEYLGRRLAVFSGLAIGILVWSVFYVLAGKRNALKPS